MPFRRRRGPEVWAQQPAVDWGNPINQGMVLCYPLSETGGTIARDVGPWRQQGTYTGFNPLTRASGPVQTGSAVSFDGATQSVLGSTNAPLGTSVVSISAWVWLNAQVNFGTLISKANLGVNDSAQWDWGLLMQSAGGLGLYCIRNGANNSPAGTMPTGAWFHVGAVISDVESLLYFNGVSVTSQGGVGVGATSNNSGRTVCLGKVTASAGYAGRLSNVRIYNRKLIQSEIYQLFSRPMTGFLAPRRRIISQVAASARPQIIRPSPW